MADNKKKKKGFSENPFQTEPSPFQKPAPTPQSMSVSNEQTELKRIDESGLEGKALFEAKKAASNIETKTTLSEGAQAERADRDEELASAAAAGEAFVIRNETGKIQMAILPNGQRVTGPESVILGEIGGRPTRDARGSFEGREEQLQQFVGEVEEAGQGLGQTGLIRDFEARGGQLNEFGEPILQTTEEREEAFRQGLADLGYNKKQIDRMIQVKPLEQIRGNLALSETFLDENGKMLNSFIGRTYGELKGVGGDLFGVSAENIVNIMTNPEDAEILESALGKHGEMFSGIRGLVDAGGVDIQTGLAMMDREEQGLRILQLRIAQAAVLEPSIKQTGRYTSILVEFDKTMIELEEARADMLLRGQESGEINFAKTSRILEELRK